jgi:hypothetical protein
MTYFKPVWRKINNPAEAAQVELRFAIRDTNSSRHSIVGIMAHSRPETAFCIPFTKVIFGRV